MATRPQAGAVSRIRRRIFARRKSSASREHCIGEKYRYTTTVSVC